MTGTGKNYSVKEWFANKVAQEVKRNINMCDVFGILKETEKAIYAVLNLGTNFSKIMWIPKSVLVDSESAYETYKFETVDEALKEFKIFWKDFI